MKTNKTYQAPSMEALTIRPAEMLCGSGMTISSGSGKSGDAKGRIDYDEEEENYTYTYGGLW